jgi:fumarate reductase subunit C
MVDVREAVWRRKPGWWMGNGRYVLFMLRELGGALCAVYGIVLLGLLVAFDRGPASYANYLAFLQTPGMLVVQAVLLVFILIHAFTWFHLIGKSQAVMSSYRAPGWTRVMVLMIVVFLAASAGVLFVVFGGL